MGLDRNKFISYVLIGLFVMGLMGGGFYYGTHYEALKENKTFMLVFNIVTWGSLGWTVLYWVFAVVRKKTRAEAVDALKRTAQAEGKLFTISFKWTLIYAAISIFIFFILWVIISVRKGHWV